jgi:hypothetical protein
VKESYATGARPSILQALEWILRQQEAGRIEHQADRRLLDSAAGFSSNHFSERRFDNRNIRLLGILLIRAILSGIIGTYFASLPASDM